VVIFCTTKITISCVLAVFLFSVQGMSDRSTFKSVFEGKQNILEEKIDTEHGLLAKLEADRVITKRHRNAIQVILLSLSYCLRCFVELNFLECLV